MPLLGSSAVMHAVRRQLRRLAAVPWPVRIEGPSGSGKGAAAGLLHIWSPRSGGPFIRQSLTVIAPGLEISSLVGWTRGSYTGAIDASPGVFESAHNGTLFLDEIADASSLVQGALLQLLEDGSVKRLGEQRPRKIDVRLVFATNANLEAAVRDGRFRGDLYHRLGTLIVRMPALRERVGDIPEIAVQALVRSAKEINTYAPEISGSDLARLLGYSWPGNVRELENAMKHLLVYRRLPEAICIDTPGGDWRGQLGEALRRHGGNKSAVARELGISRQTVYDEIRHRTGAN